MLRVRTLLTWWHAVEIVVRSASDELLHRRSATRSGLSIDTIRYYDSLGLLVDANRDGSGRRQFDDNAVRWLVFLRQMRATGMSLDSLREYINHRERGAEGSPVSLRCFERTKPR